MRAEARRDDTRAARIAPLEVKVRPEALHPRPRPATTPEGSGRAACCTCRPWGITAGRCSRVRRVRQVAPRSPLARLQIYSSERRAAIGRQAEI